MELDNNLKEFGKELLVLALTFSIDTRIADEVKKEYRGKILNSIFKLAGSYNIKPQDIAKIFAGIK